MREIIQTSKQKATAYLRTSSATNVEGDSPYRQNEAVMAYAERQGVEVISCFWDAAVSGADPLDQREGFSALLSHCLSDGIKLVLVEDASRFARQVRAQENGIFLLAAQGIRLVTASGQDLTTTHYQSKAMRHMLGLMAEYEKDAIVSRLREARSRIRDAQGKCEGRKSHAELRPELAREAKRLARRSPKTGQRRSLRQVATELAKLGYVSGQGRPLSPSIISKLVRP